MNENPDATAQNLQPEGPLRNVKDRLKKARYYLENELWYRKLPPTFTGMGLLLRLMRFLHLMYRSFKENPLRLHASALTFNTLLSLLPMLAVALAIAKGLGQDDHAITWVLDNTRDMPDEFRKTTQTLLETVAQTNFAKLGAIGALFLFYVCIQMLAKVEISFNRIWGVDKHRSLPRRITNYISVLVVVPILVLTAISTTAHWGLTGEFVEQAGKLAITPFLASWVGFAFLYGALPNTNVKLSSAVIAGFIGSLFFHVWFRAFINLQPGVLKYNLIYGALAFFPIFLIWLHFSWIIILIGAKISFAVQNGNTFQRELSVRKACTRAAILIGLALLEHAARFLKEDGPPLQRKSFLKHHDINPFIMDQATEMLVQANLLASIGEDNQTYVLLKDPSRIEIAEVIRLFIQKNGEDIHQLGVKNLPDNLLQTLEQSFQGMSAQHNTLADLIAEPKS